MSDQTVDTPAITDASEFGEAWGDNISEERQRELEAILAAWDAETDHGDRKGPFAQVQLTGADVFYLAARALVGTTPLPRLKAGAIADLNAARVSLRDPKQRYFLDLSALRLEGSDLTGAHLTGANLRKAQLADTNLRDAKLEHSELTGMQLAHAHLWGAHLQGANLSLAELQGAALIGANLQGADLTYAQLQDASLVGAKLQGAKLIGAQLEHASLGGATLNEATSLGGANLRGVSLDQVKLGDTNLAVVSWEDVTPLGDETYVRGAEGEDNVDEYKAAVRANRLLATALRAQGLAEDADVFAYRAQVMQRGLYSQQRKYGRWLISWGLAALSGYGYRLGNIFVAYSLVLAIFALIFWVLGVHSFSAEPGWQALWDSVLVSLSAIHGRATFETLGAWSPAAWAAAIESVIGIVIEGVFVAMLIQRLFR